MIEDIYQRRAELLARPLAADDGAERVPVLTFRLGAADFGVEVPLLAEVFPYRGCTPVGGGPAALVGVLNVRGSIRAVVDLSRLFGVDTDDPARGYLLMARRQGRLLALRVDEIGDIRRVETSRLTVAAARPSRFVKTLLDGTLRVVDMDAVFAALGISND